MKKIILFLLPAIIGTILLSCDKGETAVIINPAPLRLSAEGAQVVASSNDFGIELFTRVAQNEEGNLMLSPLSASIALTMLLNGCNAETYNQIRDMLGYPQSLSIGDINNAYIDLVEQLLEVDPRVKLAIANAVFYRLDFSVKAPFLKTIATDFDATIEALDFSLPSALNTINQWASDNTNKKIPKVLEEISPNTVMFLMNALYFKGTWTYQFDEATTSDRPFILEDGNVIQVKTMEGKVNGLVHHGTGYTAIELPYGRKNYSMVIMLPQNTLSNFYASFTPSVWHELTETLDMYTEWPEIAVQLPRFKFEYEEYLNKPLQDMGMVDAFDSGRADLSGITDEGVFVSFVKQNTFVEVNEEGTEAAAVTTIAIDRTSAGPSVYAINRPFVFAIRERTTNTLLFMGGVTNPAL
jgi:serpin B